MVAEGQPAQAGIGNDVAFDQRNFHPNLVTTCRSLFVDGYFSKAIEDGCKLIDKTVQDKSGIRNSGDPLMDVAFSPKNPVLCLNERKNQSDEDEQKGFMFLFKGTMAGIRNPKAHEFIVLKDRIRALEYLSFLSLLLRRLDGCTVRK